MSFPFVPKFFWYFQFFVLFWFFLFSICGRKFCFHRNSFFIGILCHSSILKLLFQTDDGSEKNRTLSFEKCHSSQRLRYVFLVFLDRFEFQHPHRQNIHIERKILVRFTSAALQHYSFKYRVVCVSVKDLRRGAMFIDLYSF